MLSIDENELRKFSKTYVELLRGKFSGINLTRILDEEEFYQKQIYDSLAPMMTSEDVHQWVESSQVVVDVGFGGGFPILPMAMAYPHKKFLGIDARAKKAKVVNEIAKDFKITNASCHHGRIEDFIFDHSALVTFKAVGDVNDFLPLIEYSKSLQVLFYKGPNFLELEKLNTQRLRDYENILLHNYSVPGTEGRLAVGFKTKNVPRGTISKNEKKIKISQLL